MRLPLAVLASAGLIAAGCGWSPPGAAPPKPDTCTPADGPAPGTVQREIGATPPASGPWTEVARGHALDCRLHWVQIAPAVQQSDSPQQVLFFDGDRPLGPATPSPRPYVSVLTGGQDTVQVQYQWRQGDEAPCCPTGIGTVRFRIGQDGTLEALDPIPNS
ncbi:hypothetical protein A5757_03770 [Mycobacterium sp. 852013-51886_SCH5428379]|uniref:LppP/LprE family lipoprotein n=1 Tax=Mycobacterium sp. 852013-51886_SCH5428379 TaxID=1834111 RepID=UPI0008000261|nr:LppP/LprE family lipoprotein [Mycobacterium sp. 852013-51886_SCH5428379]OBB56150.1 hypothetical protein A5757_03770 [Mycobacterium sp. 852013-51886_SCH5428379]